MFAPFRSLSPADIDCIRDFVSAGGSLLVAAEHTNLGGTRDAYNQLLAPYGIAINFDTVTSLLDDSIKGTHTYNHPLGRVIARYPHLQYNRGASLSVRGRDSDPVLVGDLWYTEVGDRQTRKVAFSATSGGRKVTSWATRSSSPHVVEAEVPLSVFGDTSPFINRNLAFNADFLRDVLAYLNGGSPTELNPFRPEAQTGHM